MTLASENEVLLPVPIDLLESRVNQRLNGPEYADWRTDHHEEWQSLYKGQLRNHKKLVRLVTKGLRREISLWCEEARRYGERQGLRGAGLADFCLKFLEQVIFPKMQQRYEDERNSYAMAAQIPEADKKAIGGIFSFGLLTPATGPDPLDLHGKDEIDSKWATFSRMLYMAIHEEVKRNRAELGKERNLASPTQCQPEAFQQGASPVSQGNRSGGPKHQSATKRRNRDPRPRDAEIAALIETIAADVGALRTVARREGYQSIGPLRSRGMNEHPVFFRLADKLPAPSQQMLMDALLNSKKVQSLAHELVAHEIGRSADDIEEACHRVRLKSRHGAESSERSESSTT